jgi:hypothetical protein
MPATAGYPTKYATWSEPNILAALKESCDQPVDLGTLTLNPAPPSTTELTKHHYETGRTSFDPISVASGRAYGL